MSSTVETPTTATAAAATAADSGFEFPEIHNFPPFFTRQPNESTWKEQRRMWCDLILTYFRHMNLSGMTLAEVVTDPLFNNKKIHRSLRVDMLREIVEELVKQGNACWTGPKNTNDACLVFWRKPEAWASIIHQWVSDAGMLNTVLTLFELANGEDTVDQEFHNIDPVTLRRALDVLQVQGKAQLFVGTSDDDIGVKFFA